MIFALNIVKQKVWETSKWKSQVCVSMELRTIWNQQDWEDLFSDWICKVGPVQCQVETGAIY